MARLTASARLLACCAAAASLRVDGMRVTAASQPAAFRSAAALCVDYLQTVPFPAALRRQRMVDELAMQLEQRCAGERHAMFVATDDAKTELIGCVELGLLPPPPTRPGADVPYIANLIVAPSARRRGVAAQLVAECEGCCRQWEQPQLFCKVERENIPARRLYDKCGFRPIFVQNLPADWTNRQRGFIFLLKELGA